MEDLKEKAEKVKEGVKETLLGVEDESQTSDQTRSEFMQQAKKDDDTGEWYMGETEFVNAVAPAGEDYVSTTTANSVTHLTHSQHPCSPHIQLRFSGTLLASQSHLRTSRRSTWH